MEIYVWGTGCAAGELADHGLEPAQIRAFIDSQPRQSAFLGRPVLRPEDLAGRPVDLILVASRHAEAIAARAAQAGLPPEKLLFLRNNWTLRDRNADYTATESLLRPETLSALQKAPRVMPEPLWAEKSVLDKRDLENDPVRVRTLEALCARLRDVPGAAAELGVYKGGFARCINALLPERRLYLFDTFDGFAEAENAEPGLREAHRNASAARVLSLMPHQERVVLRPGLFPETAAELEEERFALVSLDVDLEESTLAGLRFFIPRLAPGGYLLLHDWASPLLPGVKRALARYEAESARRLLAVPLADRCGTLVICG